MSNQFPYSGPGHVSEYQVSGVPYVTTSTGASLKVSFPYLTQWVTVRAMSAPVTVSFTPSGVSTGNSFVIPTSGSVGPLYLRVSEMFVTGANANVIAGLTCVDTRSLKLISPTDLATLTSALHSGAVAYFNFVSYLGL